ncbi:MAG TPA: phosphotransferase, partial [Thermomicrobiales bacterium]|nr:phosphotransferase [Thermomicrobiales bacterium]
LDRSLMLTTAIPGASLNDAPPSNPAPILTAAGADLARINRVLVDGFDWILRDDPRPTRLSAALPTWHEFAASLTTHPLDPWFDPPSLARITELTRIPPANPARALLAHGDFDPSHIFSQNGNYTGIIDLGEIRGAEATFDLGHLALHTPDALPAILQGYATITRLPDDLPLQITASALRIGWFRLTQSSAGANPPYATHLVHAMTRLALDPGVPSSG